MKIDDIIILEDNRRYSLLEKTDYEGETYFLAIAVNENDEPDYRQLIILQSMEDEDGTYVNVVSNEKLILKLTKIFDSKIKEEK